jgi:hypothetical protein
MSTLVNLTPHVINMMHADGSIEVIEASGVVARHTEQRIIVGSVNGIALYAVSYGEVSGLPEQTEDTFYIVSMPVRLALPTRKDLLSPGDLVRDSEGKPIGCKGFATN